MSVWKQLNKFPIDFKPLPGFETHDETSKKVLALNKLTPMIVEIFKELSGLPGGKSPRALQKELLEFFVLLEPSGFLVCLGIRRTIGS